MTPTNLTMNRLDLQRWSPGQASRWHNFKRNIRLYHGTSSVNVPSIQKSGLVRPVADNQTRIEEALQLYGVPRRLRGKCMPHLCHLLTWNPDHLICLSVAPLQAAGYARHNFRNGCEFNQEVKRGIESALGKQLQDIYPDAVPVVVEVLVPAWWMSDLNEMNRDKRSWREIIRNKDWHECAKFELRTERNIPPSKIKQVMKPADGHVTFAA